MAESHDIRGLMSRTGPEFLRLTWLYLEDEISSDELRRFADQLAGDALRREVFVRFSTVYSVMSEEFAGRVTEGGPDDGTEPEAIDRIFASLEEPNEPPSEAAPPPVAQPTLGSPSNQPARAPSSARRSKWRLAAMVLLPLAAAVALLWHRALPRPIATLVAQRDAQWDVSPGSPQPGQPIAGEPLFLKAGSAEVRFRSGVTMVLQSPARFAIRSDGAQLELGRLSATVPGNARGFTVRTPSAQVVDLGTQFSVSIGAGGSTEVEVFKGSVRTESQGKPGEAQILVAGQGARVTSSAVTLEPAGAVPQHFAADLQSESIAAGNAPVTIFDDPLWHGAADPAVVWNERRRQWLIYYTQRRPTLPHAQASQWLTGTAIGIAASTDGVHWEYIGNCAGDEGLLDPTANRRTWSAPSVIWDGGVYHLFVTCREDRSPDTAIRHFISQDGLTWKSRPPVGLSSKLVSHPSTARIEQTYCLWYTDDQHGSQVWMAQSQDAERWQRPTPALADVPSHGSRVWQWKGRWWMIVSSQSGIRVYESADGTKDWALNADLLVPAGGEKLAAPSCPCVRVDGGRAYLLCASSGGPPDLSSGAQLSAIQMAELQLTPNGKVVCVGP